MEKLRFEFVVKAGEDPKTNVICITSITDTGEHTFLIPEQLQPARLHEIVIKTQAFQKVKVTLQRRHEKRKVWIAATQEIREIYMDQDGNMQFKGYFLEEVPQEVQQGRVAGISEEALSRILESFAETKMDTTEPQTCSIKKLTDKFVIEKFNPKTANVSQWIVNFETECKRLGVDKNTEKIESLRLYLEDSCLDWYSSMLIKHTVNSDWSLWKSNFCATYVDKSWSPIRYALGFKYRQGPLLDYALKKEKLLLEMNKTMDKSTLIDLIAIGLPNFIADKIDRDSLKETEDLFGNIRGLEYLVNKKNLERKLGSVESKMKDKSVRSTVNPCRICEKENKGVRYHPETLCWFRIKNIDKPKREQIRSINNSELETELNEIDPKN